LDQPPPKAIPAARGHCWLRLSAMSMSSMSGGSCARRRSTSPGANPGARATIPSSLPRLPTWSGMAPPENAIVICVDEKPSIQALERGARVSETSNGRTLTGRSHDYQRNGTTTLLAAFEVASGKVTAAHKKRRRRVEFLDFMNDIVAAYPDTAIHVVLDNLNIHKPRNDRWLKSHQRAFPLHDDARSTKWKSGSRSFTSVGQLRSTSMPSSTTTTAMQNRSSGPNPKFTKNASKSIFRRSMIPGTRPRTGA
jgi:DDE superfamily endonuclease